MAAFTSFTIIASYYPPLIGALYVLKVMTQPRRYKVTFELLHPDEAVSYKVHTLYGESKAIVIATQAHEHNGKGHILSVSVKALSNDEPQGHDYDDRMEW